MEKVDKLFAAMKAFIVHEGKVLLLRESVTYEDGTNLDKWIEPGGRVEPGENFRDGLVREIKEETGLEVDVTSPFYVDEWRPKVRGEQWQIIGTFFVCRPHAIEVVLGNDHEEYRWVTPEEAATLPLAPETLKAFKALKEWLTRNAI